MAISYDDWKKQYTELDAAWKQKFVDLAKNSDVGKEYMQRYASEMNTTPKTTTTPTPTPTPTKTETTPTPTTTTTTTTPTTPTTSKIDVAGIKGMWDNLSYDEQQKYLGQYKWLQESLTAKGITNKTKPTEWTTGTTGTTWTTPNKWEWDYQDSSEGRMYEMANNLNNYRVSDPNLFSNWDTFSNFFIDWKDRSQEQLNYLKDYFNAVKRYNSLDNMTADSVWNMLANWAIPEDYLNYLKYANPQRYSEVMDAKARATDKIKDSAELDSILDMTWDLWKGEWVWSKMIEWAKSNWLLVDKDWDLIEDRISHQASEEEKTYAKEYSDNLARIMELQQTKRDIYDDYVAKYPWATKATLMAMTNDATAEIQKEIDNLTVENTRLQWYITYAQSERQEMNKAWADTITQLNKSLWMYYQYSPEGIAELTEAQYSATNITLDQADTWTDAQKQIALQWVLDWYYQKFWDIIERSEQQVINDVIRLAKEKGITLSEALQENFITPLKNKPNYLMYATWWDNWYWDWKVVWKDALWNDVYWFVNSSTWVVVPYGNISGWYWTWYWAWGYDANWVYQFSDWEVREVWADGKFTDTIWNDINSIWHILASNDWIRVWTYQSPNWYTYNVYANREDWIRATEQLLRNSYYWMTLWDAAQKWIGQGKDITAAKNVIRNAWLRLSDKLSDSNARAFIEAMGTWEGTLQWKSLDDWAKWGKDLSWYGKQATSFDNSMSKAYDEYAEAKTDKERAAIAARYWKTVEQMDKEAYQYDWWRNAEDVKSLIDEIDKMLDWEIKIPWVMQRMDTADTWELSPITSFFIPWSSVQANRSWLYSHNLIHDTLWMNKLIDLKSRWATFWALSDPERVAINNVATKLAPWMEDAEYKQTLREIRSELVKSAHWYLDSYHYQGWTMSNAASELWLTK